jgi:AcrR family transcriptional regulator
MKNRKIKNGTNEIAEKIIKVAIDLFASNGFKGTSIRDIAKIAGTTSSNIYYYFRNKEGLLFAILEQSTRQIVEKLRQIAESDLEPLERFKLLLKTHLSLLLDLYRKESKVLFLDEEHVARINKQYQLEILNMYRKVLRYLQSLGYVNYNDITILSFHIFGVLNWHIRWYKPEGPKSVEQINNEMLSFVLHGALSSPQTDSKLIPNP